MTTCEFCNSEYDEENYTAPEAPIADGICFYCGSEPDIENVPPKVTIAADNSAS